jgi:hypothetical protein
VGKAKVQEEGYTNSGRGANPNPRYGNVGGGSRGGLTREKPMVTKERERDTSDPRCEESRIMGGWEWEDQLIASTATEMVTSRHPIPTLLFAIIVKKMGTGP